MVQNVPHTLAISFGFRATGGSAAGGGAQVTMTKSEFTAECYNMNHKERGCAVIFNNKKFDPSTGMGERSGTDVDATNLYMILSEMGFNTIVKHDCTTREMESFLVKSDYHAHCFSLLVFPPLFFSSGFLWVEKKEEKSFIHQCVLIIVYTHVLPVMLYIFFFISHSFKKIK